MSHEETAGMSAKAVTTDVQGVVQSLMPRPNTAAGSEVEPGVADDGQGTVVRAMEAIRAEAEVAASVAQAKEPVTEGQEGNNMAGTALTGKVRAKTTRAKRVATQGRVKAANAKKAPTPAGRVKSRGAKKSIGQAPAAGADAKVRKVKAAQALAATKASKAKPPQEPVKFTVPEVWRSIAKKNERQGSKRYDVLVCQHAVPANDNTYRTARACPECRLSVQRYADEVAAARARKAPRRRKA